MCLTRPAVKRTRRRSISCLREFQRRTVDSLYLEFAREKVRDKEIKSEYTNVQGTDLFVRDREKFEIETVFKLVIAFTKMPPF